MSIPIPIPTRLTNSTGDADETDENGSADEGLVDSSRRTLAMMSLLGTGVLAAGSSTANDETILSNDAPAAVQTDEMVLVSMSDYRPEMTVRVVERLPATITVQLLALPNGETVPVLTQPDEYTGYVVRSEFSEEQIDTTTLVFVRDSLEAGTRYEFGSDAQVFSDRLNLFRASIARVE